jgi:hypothetical protein
MLNRTVSLIILATNLSILIYGCSLEPPDGRTKYPIRSMKRVSTPESKLFRPLRNTILKKWHYPVVEEREDYDLVFNGNKILYGFKIQNLGKNKVIPKKYEIGKGPKREFFFSFIERSRQDIHLSVTDYFTDSLKDEYETRLYFFPRKNIPAVILGQNRDIVQLPNNERILFNRGSHTIYKGPIVEVSPIEKKRFPNIKYTGSSLIARMNLIGDKMSPTTMVEIIHPEEDESCFVSSSALFVGTRRPVFKYGTDDSFEEFLMENCGYDIPGL